MMWGNNRHWLYLSRLFLFYIKRSGWSRSIVPQHSHPDLESPLFVDRVNRRNSGRGTVPNGCVFRRSEDELSPFLTDGPKTLGSCPTSDSQKLWVIRMTVNWRGVGQNYTLGKGVDTYFRGLGLYEIKLGGNFCLEFWRWSSSVLTGSLLYFISSWWIFI